MRELRVERGCLMDCAEDRCFKLIVLHVQDPTNGPEINSDGFYDKCYPGLFPSIRSKSTHEVSSKSNFGQAVKSQSTLLFAARKSLALAARLSLEFCLRLWSSTTICVRSQKL